MQKPNYQFEKRRKEMDKKAKKEEKRRQKLAGERTSAADPAPTADGTAAPDAPAEPT